MKGNAILKDLVLAEVQKCKNAGMNQDQTLFHIQRPEIAQALKNQAAFEVVK